jgi:hypothetical protein
MLDSLSRISSFKTISENLAVGGQPAEPYFPTLRKAGFGLVIHIETEGVGSIINREDLIVLENEMLYEKITIDFNHPNVEDFLYLAQLLDKFRKLRVYVHCTAGYCSSALIVPFLMTKYGWSLSEALESVVAWNIPSRWQEAINGAIDSLEKA